MDYNNNHVNRSYHQSKAIREYQDRGMMKWQGFYLSEHTSAMKTWKKVEQLPEIKVKLDEETKVMLLNQSMLNRFLIKAFIKNSQDEKSREEKTGTVKEFFNSQELMLETGKNQYERVLIKDIYDIHKADN